MTKEQAPQIWTTAPHKLTLSHHEVHVWQTILPIQPEILTDFENNLSSEELQRLHKLHLQADKTRFIVGRGGLKQILARYLHLDATKICLSYTPYGKPYLEGAALHFNFSHSGNYILYAISNAPVGIDVEYCDQTLDFLMLAKEFCSDLEWYTLSTLATKQHSTMLFYHYWTQKEAFVKAIGKGLGFPLKKVNKDFALELGWIIKDIMLHKEYAASIALPIGTKHMTYWQSYFETI